MKKFLLLTALCTFGCSSTKEYTTQCNFNVPVNKPLDNSTLTVEVKVKGNY